MLKAGFVILTLFMAALVFAGVMVVSGRSISDSQKQKQFRLQSLLLLVGWLSYIFFISLTGIFTTTTLPPRMPLLLILPCLLFFLYFFRSGRFTDFIDATPAGWLVYTQSFRIPVELLLLGMYMEGLIPKAGTFEGYNYEIFIGISALGVGYFGFTKRRLPHNFIIVWNFLGNFTLAIIGFIMISHAYFPGIYDHPGHLSVKDFGSFPYTLLVGFLAPLAIFLHIFSMVKTNIEKRAYS